LAFHSGREADYSPPSSAEVKAWVELYLYSPNAPSWRVAQLRGAQGQLTSVRDGTAHSVWWLHYWLDWCSILGSDKELFFSTLPRPVSGANPASYPTGTGGKTDGAWS
jgi:hypothetical protein